MIKLQIIPEREVSLQVLEPVVKPVIAPKRITENGTYAAKEEGVYGFDPVEVDVDLTPAFEAGQKAEYDRFWDAYLQNGNIIETSMLFAGKGWNDITFKPKYSIRAENPYMLFRQSQMTDIGRSLKDQGVVFRLRGNVLQYTFNAMASKTLDNIVFAEPITTMYTAFGSATNLEHIECPIPVQDANISGDSFSWCVALKEIRFTGTINSNLSFDKSNLLSAQSVQSILDALKDRTGLTSLTLTLHKDVGEKLTNEQKAAITAKNWILVY